MELFTERKEIKKNRMKKRDAFSDMHPAVSFFFFIFVLAVTMLVNHPAVLAISFTAALCLSVYLKGRAALKLLLAFVLPVMLLTACLNPLFNHAGVTMLFYLSNGNPVTLEAICYGIAASCMFGSVLMWFSCYNHVMTSDKFIYLFGRVIPSLSLLLSMALRFVPRFSQKIKETQNAQRFIGRDIKSGNIFKRIYCALRIISITVTWALESAVVTADSMKSRGYGLRGRTAYSIYHFDSRDRTVMTAFVLCAVIFAAEILTGGIYIRYYPTIRMNGTTVFSLAGHTAFFISCFLPTILNIMEDIRWKSLESKI